MNDSSETEQLRQWVRDLQSGMYINCVYCGFRYGPKDVVPASMAEALKTHVEQCPKHPMSELKRDLEYAVVSLTGLVGSKDVTELKMMGEALLPYVKSDADAGASWAAIDALIELIKYHPAEEENPHA